MPPRLRFSANGRVDARPKFRREPRAAGGAAARLARRSARKCARTAAVNAGSDYSCGTPIIAIVGADAFAHSSLSVAYLAHIVSTCARCPAVITQLLPAKPRARSLRVSCMFAWRACEVMRTVMRAGQHCLIGARAFTVCASISLALQRLVFLRTWCVTKRCGISRRPC